MAEQAPITTIPPFGQTALPACAASCGPLYDANGACVPPAAATAAASIYTSCFCSNNEISGLASATTGICDGVCNSQDMGSIQSWFTSICNANDQAENNGGGNGGDSGSSSSSSASGDSGSSSGSSNNGDGGDWFSNHWQWVIFLIVAVLAIVGIWVGACIWRRRYLRKKDRQQSLGQKQSGSASHPSWGPGLQAPPPGGIANSESGHTARTSVFYNDGGVMDSDMQAQGVSEKPNKKFRFSRS